MKFLVDVTGINCLASRSLSLADEWISMKRMVPRYKQMPRDWKHLSAESDRHLAKAHSYTEPLAAHSAASRESDGSESLGSVQSTAALVRSIR